MAPLPPAPSRPSSPSRRDFLTGMTVLGAASLLPGAPDLRGEPAPAAAPSPPPVWSADDRQKATAQLLAYFAQTAPQLLRPASGTLSHPNIACSLPGKAYSSTLWDWDTYWTLRGLFRYAAITGDSAFREKLAAHAVGSVLTFFRSPV